MLHYYKNHHIYLRSSQVLVENDGIITYGSFHINEECLRNLKISQIMEGAYLHVDEEALQKGATCESKPGAHLYGPASKYILNLQLRCVHSIINTAVNRSLFSIQDKFGEYNIDQKERIKFRQFCMSNIKKIFGFNKDIPIMSFETWLKRFTGSKLMVKQNSIEHAHLLAVLDSIKSYRGIYKRKMFMKRELIAKLVLEKFQPRLVTGATSELNVIWGRYIFTFSKVFSHIFGGHLNTSQLN
jgi:hypothetical protein